MINVSQELEEMNDLNDIDTLLLYENDLIIDSVVAFVTKHHIVHARRGQPSIVLELVRLIDYRLKQLNSAPTIEE